MHFICRWIYHTDDFLFVILVIVLFLIVDNGGEALNGGVYEIIEVVYEI